MSLQELTSKLQSFTPRLLQQQVVELPLNTLLSGFSKIMAVRHRSDKTSPAMLSLFEKYLLPLRYHSKQP